MATVEKSYTIAAPLSQVYDALTKEDLIEHWSGSPATMDLKTDGEFSLWGGSIHGINKEISLNKIVQLWKEESWEDYSTCVFTLVENDNTTVLTLEHTDVLEKSAKSVDQGWDEYYLGPLKEMLEN